MIRANIIQSALLHLIGWQQDYSSADLQISDSLTESTSGLYFQQVHPLLTLQNLHCIAPDFSNMHYPAYSSDKDYAQGAIVSYEGSNYKAIIDSTGILPTDASAWEPVDLFSAWLEAKTKAGIQKAINRFYTEKLVKGTAKALCENKTLFENTGRITDTVKNRKNLVGFEIVPIRSRGVTTKINKIGLQFTEPGVYKLYLMHSSSAEPIKTLEFTKVKAGTMEWFKPEDLYLPYLSADIDAGGSWYLCYKQSELPEGSLAIRKERDWSKGPCSSCSRNEFISWQAWSKYIEVHPFYVNEEIIPADSEDASMHLWDVESNVYTYDTNYGINLEVSVMCDFTDFIVEQKELFTDVIAKQVAVDFLREFAYNANVRTNRHSINASRLDILYELDGDSASMKKSGLNYALDQAIKALELNTRGVDRICQPCNNNGIKYRVV